jgi:signal transduction histidine kinase
MGDALLRAVTPPQGTSTDGSMPDEPAPVLVVDDEARNLDVLEATLAETGCHLVRARSADEALLALLDRDFAAIVLDVKMPGMSGFELASIVRARRRMQQVPILFLTAYMLEDADMLRGYEAGAVDYLTKPINPKVLRAKISAFVSLFHTSRALARTNEALSFEIAERQRAEEALRNSNQELEQRVHERTAALTQAHEELVSADRRKDEFLATLAHELRNPLAPIRHAVEIARMTPEMTKEVDWAIGVVERQARHMTRLVDDLLDVSRITRAHLELRREVVDLGKVLLNAVEASRPLIDSARHTLSMSLGDELLRVNGDPTRLAQVFGNLLNNSTKYAGPGGRIEITVTRQENEVSIGVRDTGIGIAPQALPRIFEMFTQVDSSSERRQGGLGVGLALAKRVVELHGGRISAHSEGEGKGSEFVVTLPLVEVTAEGGTVVPQTSVRTSTPSRRVLVADDNEDAALSLMKFLEMLGHEVRVAFDGAAALEVAAEFRPSFILMDIGMPRVNGYEAARRIRQEPWGTDIHMVALTGWGQAADKRRARDAGFNDHLTKPAEPEAVARAVAGAGPVPVKG